MKSLTSLLVVNREKMKSNAFFILTLLSVCVSARHNIIWGDVNYRTGQEVLVKFFARRTYDQENPHNVTFIYPDVSCIC